MSIDWEGSYRRLTAEAVDSQRQVEPYLQPDPTRDCSFYATAYIARCLGHPEVTAHDVMAWREANDQHEDWYLDVGLGLTREQWSTSAPDEERRIWWMGQTARPWVQRWLDDGWIGKAYVHRVASMSHAVAVLGYTDEGVRLMDPVLGFVTEPWDWFLGIGPGTYGCHRVASWYRTSQPLAEAS